MTQPVSHSVKRQKHIDSRIVAALERISQTLRILLWEVAKEHGLSPIQIQFLIFLHTHQRKRRKVSILAREFDLTPATVSDAIKVLSRKGLTAKKPSQLDGRCYTLELTSSGRRLTAKLLGWQAGITEQIKHVPPDRKESVVIFLTELITSLQRGGIINTARMCITCSFFQRDAHPGSTRPHQCRLTGRSIADCGVEIDCDKYESRNG